MQGMDEDGDTYIYRYDLKDKTGYTIETKAGVLRVRADGDGLILMEQNAPAFYDRPGKEESG